VLGGGDDHALLATFPPGTPLPEGFVAVGEITAGEPGVLVDGEPWAGPAGHDHFR
jgi:thiamine-monophosphate kinase